MACLKIEATKWGGNDAQEKGENACRQNEEHLGVLEAGAEGRREPRGHRRGQSQAGIENADDKEEWAVVCKG